jgi:glycosyltransferase involved in cell wall biosynthesis
VKFASICVLSYKRPLILGRCINSIHQTADFPFELIVNDDGSDLETRDYLFSLLDADLVSWLVYNGGQNMGLGRSMRNCFDLSRGDYVIKLDADLQLSPGWLSASISLLDSYEKLGVLGLFRYSHKPVDFRDMYIETVSSPGALSYEVHKDFVGSALLMRRDIYDRFGPVGEGSAAYAEDFMFKMKVREAGYHLGLPMADLAVNSEFGIGKSVVVQEDGQVRAVSPLSRLFCVPETAPLSLTT